MAVGANHNTRATKVQPRRGTWNMPAAHSVQAAVLKPEAYCPAPQGVQMAAAGAAYFPGMQERHLVAAVAPVEARKVPAGQAAQAVAPGDGP